MSCKLVEVKKHILGLHLDFPYLRISHMRKTGRTIELIGNKSLCLLSEEANVKPLYMKERHSHFRGSIVSGLGSKDFLMRALEMKIASSKHAEEAVAFQSEALGYFKPGEALTVPVFDKQKKGAVVGFVLTVPRERLQAHLTQLQDLGIDPDVVSIVPSALCHFIRWKFPDLTDAILIDVGSHAVTCAVLEKGMLKKAHTIQMGVEELFSALYEDRKRILLKKEIEGAAKQIDLLLFKSQLNPHLSKALNHLRQELAKIYFAFTRDAVKPVLFTGKVDAFTHLREFLIEFAEGTHPLSTEEQTFAVSMGLCLEQFSKSPLQLRKEEFFPKRNWIRMGRIALALLVASCTLSCASLGFGLHAIHRNKLSMLPNPSLSEGSLDEQIDTWIGAIEENNKEYPYLMQSPKVSDILAWLSSHPLLQTLKEEGDPIEIKELRTQLVSFPSLQSKNDPYLVKVELEFQFKNMTNARKFHDALREGDQLVNPYQEITWEPLNDSCRACFYLKNRGPYVP